MENITSEVFAELPVGKQRELIETAKCPIIEALEDIVFQGENPSTQDEADRILSHTLLCTQCRKTVNELIDEVSKAPEIIGEPASLGANERRNAFIDWLSRKASEGIITLGPLMRLYRAVRDRYADRLGFKIGNLKVATAIGFKEDKKVELRKVTLGQREDDNIIVNKGINPKDHVVLSGQLNLYNGAEIYIQKEEKLKQDDDEQEKDSQ